MKESRLDWDMVCSPVERPLVAFKGRVVPMMVVAVGGLEVVERVEGEGNGGEETVAVVVKVVAADLTVGRVVAVGGIVFMLVVVVKNGKGLLAE